MEEANLPIGFVFSYPCELLSIRSARLLWWTKGFDIKDCLQKDVVKLLEEALELNMVFLMLIIIYNLIIFCFYINKSIKKIQYYLKKKISKLF